MNKRIILLFLILSFITFRFCSQEKKDNENSVVYHENLKIDKLINIAKSYKEVSYKAGGTTESGMDCSSLVNASFKEVGIELPRSSKLMSAEGKLIDLLNVKPGDLLFFDIARLKGGINHVGIVTSVKDNDIHFIHSTSSKGVIVSSMKETYWKREFIKAKRIF